ncbi:MULTISPECIES: cupin domain-containing protein [unclassified Ensifer]|uniref:cupin domain-containing protein n=1 Tax=unclassified Ensifer TaxID=2633371 RepID=UPI00070C9E74|nr:MULTISPECIES: cupin domain-containing protein [unclassified Ensifer]KRD60612.1 cupin [Ensifer sp. Root278]
MEVIVHENWPVELWRPGVETRMVISAVSGASQLCLFEQWVAPGAGAPTHHHPVEEILTVIAGKAEMWIEEERIIVLPGRSLIVPPLRRHGFTNIGSETLQLQAILAAASFEARFDGSVESVRRWCGEVD